MKDKMLISTRKGLVIYRYKNRTWSFDNVAFNGIPVSIATTDPVTGTWWALLDHGHWGCKIHRSMDLGKSWQELEAPKFPEGAEIKKGVPASVKYLWAFASLAANKPGHLMVGTEPGGLFYSRDNGDTFELNTGLWNHPTREEQWFGGGREYAGIHSIVVDPHNQDHIFAGISVAGVFETEDGGNTWQPRNRGLKAEFLPDPEAEVGQDPHLLIASPSNPAVMWQQNHCGIFKSADGAKNWQEVSEKDGPAKFGFAIAVDENDADIAWVVPAISDEIRVAINHALVVCRTDDGGKSWTTFNKGLPGKGCFDIVFRHALDIDGNTLAFGTTTGNLFISDDRGESWRCLNHHLALVNSLYFA